jgi:hypothetical protein
VNLGWQSFWRTIFIGLTLLMFAPDWSALRIAVAAGAINMLVVFMRPIMERP